MLVLVININNGVWYSGKYQLRMNLRSYVKNEGDLRGLGGPRGGDSDVDI
jgi:hypothetical protein